jgi:uncharacterized protein (DUF2147 family)
MPSLFKKVAFVAAVAAFSMSAFAQSTPVGLWNQIDDETKKVQSQIRITESGGVLSGKIEKLMDPKAQGDKCNECPDDDPRKGQLILGMTIIKDMKKDGDGWAGGKILKASTGKIYKCEMTMAEGGKKLNVRGKVGFLGKTQVWERAE